MNTQSHTYMLDDASEFRVTALYGDGRADERVYLRVCSHTAITMTLDVAREMHRKLGEHIAATDRAEAIRDAKARGQARRFEAAQNDQRGGLWWISHPDIGPVSGPYSTEDIAWEHLEDVITSMSEKQQ